MGKIILFGEPMALLTADTTGALENVEHFTRSMSGAEVNVAIGLSRLGHQVEYITKLGDDPFGHYIENKLKLDGIGTSFINYDDVYKTGIQLKNRVTDGSDPYAPYYRKGSAASHISMGDIDNIKLDDIDCIHITGIPPALSESARAATFHLAKKAKEKGIFVTFDPNLRPNLWKSTEEMKTVINELSSYANLILPGISECKILLGTDDKEEICNIYHNMGIDIVVIKNGSFGAYVSDKKAIHTVNGFKVNKVVDTVGAGDGFAVGVISGFLDKLDICECVKRGNAIGAIQVMHIGDNEGLPTPTELYNFMNQSL